MKTFIIYFHVKNKKGLLENQLQNANHYLDEIFGSQKWGRNFPELLG